MKSAVDTPLVSVIIPSYNHAAYIRETLQSVCDQTWPAIEIIVIDDGSTDASPEILKGLEIPRLRLFFQENQGTASALNRGLSLAQGTYIAILNSDDRYDPERIETLVSLLEANGKSPGIAFSRVRLMDQESRPVTAGPAVEWLDAAHARLTPDTPLALFLLRDNFTCTSSNFLFHRDLLETVGGFREYRYVNDLDFLIRCLSAGEVVCSEASLLFYRIHDTNTLNERFGDKEPNYLCEWGQVVAEYLEHSVDYQKTSWDELARTVGGGDAVQLSVILLSVFASRVFGSDGVRPEVLDKVSDVLEFKAHVAWLKSHITDLEAAHERLEADIGIYTADIRKLSDANIDLFASLQEKHADIEKLNQKLTETIAQNHALAAERDAIWAERQHFAAAYEQVLNSRRYRLVEHLSGLKSFQQPVYHIKELIRILTPGLVNPLIRWRDNGLDLTGKLAGMRSGWQRVRKKLVTPVRFEQKRHHGPLVSIICPCYNYGAYLDRMLDSLARQTFQDFELIIVDDGSTDPQTISRINALMAETVPRQIVVRQANAGVIAARNYAVSLSSGKYLFPLDPDDTIDKTFLEKLLFYLEHGSPRNFAYAWTFSTGKDDFIWETRDTDPFAVLEENRCGYAVFSREAFDAAGGYSPAMKDGYEDWELCVNLVRCGYPGRVVPEPLYLYDVKPGTRNHYAEERHGQLKQLISDRHRREITRTARQFRKEMRTLYFVQQARINLDGKQTVFSFQPRWLDLTDEIIEPAALFSDLLLYADHSPSPVLVTISARWQRFFHLNPHPNLYVYVPEHYHPSGDPSPFMDWIRTQHQPEPISPDPLRDAVFRMGAPDRNRPAVLYVGPWLITGGADTMTVDWFRHLSTTGMALYYATTLPKKNVWIDKLRGLSRGIYELPELGCGDPDAIGRFIIDFIEKNQIDVLHIMNSPPVYQVLPDIRNAHPHLKIVAQFHCFDYLADGTKVGYSVDVPKRLDGIVDAYNVESISHQKEIQALYPQILDDKFTCIYGCIDTLHFDPDTVVPDAEIFSNRHPDALNLLFIGRLDRQKQPMVMMQVVKRLRDAGVDFLLHVVGDGSLESQKAEVKAYCHDHGLDDRVRFYGDQPQSTLPSWYAVGDVLLLCSMWEGIPIVLYQAMSMGMVCVAPDVGGIAELVGDAGVVIPDRTDIDAYVQTLSALATDPELRQALGSRARERIVNGFDIQTLSPAYVSFYQRLVNGGNPNSEKG
ncbi:MAG: hypothetical protein CSA22_01225 [Deltaproteobacteria bacterium]|nr:MAG: hypothetical protein CSA22_01225 [Deltaproteobacteria bacterium]